MDLSGLFNKDSGLSPFHTAFQQAMSDVLDPMTKIANARAKNTYSDIVGDQYLAKLYGVPGIQENIADPRKREDLNHMRNTALRTANNGSNASNGLFSGIRKMLFGEEPSTAPLQQNGRDNAGYQYDQAGNNVVASPQEVDQASNLTSPVQMPRTGTVSGQVTPQGVNYDTIPPELLPKEVAAKEAAARSNELPRENPPSTYGSPNTTSWNQNIANANMIKAQGTEQGKNNANDIKDLTAMSFNGHTALGTLNHLGQIISSPTFEEMRRTPLLGHYELSYFAKEGTPEQQNMVGQYITETNNIIKDSSRDFAGQFRQGEQMLLENMKLNPSDTVDTARGKLESLTAMQQMLTQRADRTAQLMADNPGLSKIKASQIADAELDGSKIRTQVHDRLNPKIKIRRKNDKGEWEINLVTPTEARRLQAKGMYNG